MTNNYSSFNFTSKTRKRISSPLQFVLIPLQDVEHQLAGQAGKNHATTPINPNSHEPEGSISIGSGDQLPGGLKTGGTNFAHDQQPINEQPWLLRQESDNFVSSSSTKRERIRRLLDRIDKTPNITVNISDRSLELGDGLRRTPLNAGHTTQKIDLIAFLKKLQQYNQRLSQQELQLVKIIFPGPLQSIEWDIVKKCIINKHVIQALNPYRTDLGTEKKNDEEKEEKQTGSSSLRE